MMSSRRKNRASQPNVYYLPPQNNAPPMGGFPAFGSFNTPTSQSPTDPHTLPYMPHGIPQDQAGNAADVLVDIKYAPSLVNAYPRARSMSHTQSAHRISTSDRMSVSSVAKIDEDHQQKVFIHRRSAENEEPVIRARESTVRRVKGQEKVIKKEEKEFAATTGKYGYPKHDDDQSIDENEEPADPLHPRIRFTSGDIVFANGNNREKRRAEVFEYYSELHKHKEKHREALYADEKRRLEKRIKKLSQPRNFNSEVATIEESQDQELFEMEQDLVEKRDYELVRLRHWRKFQRDENLKLYYEQSSQAHKKATDDLDRRLEKLKNFFIRQRSLLLNLDREMGDIGSSRAIKLYSGFVGNSSAQDDEIQDGDTIKQEEGSTLNTSNPESSETDTGASSSTNAKGSGSAAQRGGRGAGRGGRVVKKRGVGRPRKNATPPDSIPTSAPASAGTLLTSIVDGFAPILTADEFKAVVGDEATGRQALSQELAGLRGDQSDSESNTNSMTDSKKTSRGRGGRGADRDTSALNKIMKGYTSPTELKKEDVDEDVALMRSLAKS